MNMGGHIIYKVVYIFSCCNKADIVYCNNNPAMEYTEYSEINILDTVVLILFELVELKNAFAPFLQHLLNAYLIICH